MSKNLNFNKIFAEVAIKNGVPIEKMLEDMEKAIDMMWDSEDAEIKKRQKVLFGDKKPTVEQFIEKIRGELI